MQEIEAKFLLSTTMQADAALRRLATQAEVHALPVWWLHDTYLDDGDRTLRHAGWCARTRTGDRQDGVAHTWLQLKTLSPRAPAADPLLHCREELEAMLFEPPSLPLQPEEIDDQPLRSLLQSIGAGRLKPLFSLRTERASYRCTLQDGTEVEVSIDDVRVQDRKGAQRGRFLELELELHSGDAAALARLAAALAADGLTPSTLSKFERGGWLSGCTRPNKLPTVPADASAATLVVPQLSRWMARIDHYGKVAAEGLDPVGVLRVRTNIRRVRSALKVAEAELGESGVHLSQTLRGVADGAGGLRDIEVVSERLAHRLDRLAGVSPRARSLLMSRLTAGRAGARDEAGRALQALPGVLEDWRGLEPRWRDWEWPDAATFAERAVRRYLRSLRRDGNALERGSADEALHMVRLRAKRLRYVLELIRPCYGRQARDLGIAVRDLQNAFGAHQDACVAVGLLEDLGAEMPADGAGRDALILLGRLLQDQKDEAFACRKGALKCWRRFERDYGKKAFKQLLEGPR